MAYYDFLNVVFAPLLELPPFWAVFTLSLLISLLIILITKYTTDQSLMKKLKEEIKSHQGEMKKLRSDPAKAMEVQKKSMEVNMKYMSHSLRPTLITFIPIILIFGWMSSVFANESIKPQQEFSVTAFFDKNAEGKVEIIVPAEIKLVGNKSQDINGQKSTWKLKGPEGQYALEFDYKGEKQQREVLITESSKYLAPISKVSGSPITSLDVNYRKLVIMPVGYKDWFGWLGTYIIFSIIFTMVLRKYMKVY
jgi:uncharacterized membrane protein (DUF106 family)